MSISRTTELVFVFGSNLAGRHGKGAALHAKVNWGAVQGVGEGLAGSSYAIPTKDEHLKTLDMDRISVSIAKFHETVLGDSRLFVVTPVGTGLAGIPLETMRLAFDEHEWPRNVVFTADWLFRRGAG